MDAGALSFTWGYDKRASAQTGMRSRKSGMRSAEDGTAASRFARERSAGRVKRQQRIEKPELRVGQRMRSKADIEASIERHANTVMRVCSVYLRDSADREDAFQETFMRYACQERSFQGEEHRKAWLIRVASNVCKDMLKAASSKVESLDALTEAGFVPEGEGTDEGMHAVERTEVTQALMALEERYRIVLYLKFYEGYTAAQIGKLLDMPENTVYTNISRGKQQLKGVLSHG